MDKTKYSGSHACANKHAILDSHIYFASKHKKLKVNKWWQSHSNFWLLLWPRLFPLSGGFLAPIALRASSLSIITIILKLPLNEKHCSPWSVPKGRGTWSHQPKQSPSLEKVSLAFSAWLPNQAIGSDFVPMDFLPANTHTTSETPRRDCSRIPIWPQPKVFPKHAQKLTFKTVQKHTCNNYSSATPDTRNAPYLVYCWEPSASNGNAWRVACLLHSFLSSTLRESQSELHDGSKISALFIQNLWLG